MTAWRDPMDILIWSDGYWCFRSEYDKQSRLDYAYLVIYVSTKEWLYISATAGLTPANPQAAQFLLASKDDRKSRPA